MNGAGSAFETSPFVVAALLFLAIGGMLVLAGLAALFRRRPLRFTVQTVFGLLLVTAGALAGAIGMGMTGYRALTREEVAARVSVRPVGPQRFEATFTIPDRQPITHELAGDQLYVDAHILKWKPIVNILGLHTAYELDRVSGRYLRIEDERLAERTVYTLAPHRAVDLFNLRQRYAFLSPLVDAEYGSGTFTPITEPAEYEVRVSTSGLLIRRSG
jgi:hypothetical protein